MYHFPVTLTYVETPVFFRQLAECVEDDDYRTFRNELLEEPERDGLLVGSGGLRKARMALARRGKHGAFMTSLHELP
jgi:hypothetical protein